MSKFNSYLCVVYKYNYISLIFILLVLFSELIALMKNIVILDTKLSAVHEMSNIGIGTGGT